MGGNNGRETMHRVCSCCPRLTQHVEFSGDMIWYFDRLVDGMGAVLVHDNIIV